MEYTEMIYGQGDIQSALKRIGVNDSNVFAIGHDPLLKSGVIVSQGKIVSSKILDISLKSTNLSEHTDFLNKIEVKYVNSDTKHINSMTFNILNDNALIELISILKNNKELSDSVNTLIKNQELFNQKLNNINSFLNEYENHIRTIEDLKLQIIALQSEINALQKHIHLHE